MCTLILAKTPKTAFPCSLIILFVALKSHRRHNLLHFPSDQNKAPNSRTLCWPWKRYSYVDKKNIVSFTAGPWSDVQFGQSCWVLVAEKKIPCNILRGLCSVCCRCCWWCCWCLMKSLCFISQPINIVCGQYLKYCSYSFKCSMHSRFNFHTAFSVGLLYIFYIIVYEHCFLKVQ